MGNKQGDQNWDALPRPTTAHQRINDLSACQRSFGEVRGIPPCTSTLRLLQGSDIPPYDAPCLLRASSQALRVGAAACFECACCGERAGIRQDSATVANPFSDLLVLTCASCSAA